MIEKVNQLRHNLSLFQALFEGADKDFISWRKSSEDWSFLIVACHLRDEEAEDFLPRIKLLLFNPDGDFAPIDPEGWVTERAYEHQNYAEVVSSFINMRKASLDYLESLDPASEAWNNTKEHPHFGTVTAQFFLDNWLAHDLLHIRQLTRIRYDFVSANSDYSMAYAGTWK